MIHNDVEKNVNNSKKQQNNSGPSDSKYDWNPYDIFPSWQAWEAAFDEIKGPIDELESYQGHLTESSQSLLKAYQLNDEIEIALYKLYSFASLIFDTDQKNNEIRARLQQASALFAEIQERFAWMTPELLEGDETQILRWLVEEKGLAPYRFAIQEQFRLKAHTLDKKSEALLAIASRFNETPGDIYEALSTADINFNTIEINGREEQITYGTYRKLLIKAEKQDDRRRAFEAMYELYTSKKNTYAAIYESICQRDWAEARARHFNSCAEAALHHNNVPLSVLETLIDVARRGAGVLQRYHKMRAKVLNLEGNYHLYDAQYPLVPADKDYPFDDVIEMVIESVRPLGEEYTEKLRTAITSRWIDVHEKEGKRSGAYSHGVYGVHPYMLLNHNDTLDAVFTLAHELGHTLHTVYANEAQPYVTSEYTIFVAEVASTTNEGLLLNYLKSQVKEPIEKISLLTHLAESIAGTFFTQVIFAQYELEAHRMIERGEPMNADSLDALYKSIFLAFYGDSVVWDDAYATTWARIPHFYRAPFYVYQYATCFASSAQLLKGMASEESASYVDKYLNLLRSGGSDHPMSQLRTAGIDLEDPTIVGAVVEQMDALVTEIELELSKL